MASALFQPLTLRSMTTRNRIWVSPMCQYSVIDESGVPNDWHLVHLGSFARGGAGLVIAEATAVSPEGRITPRDTGLWNDEQAIAWQRIVEFIHSCGAAAGIQLNHAGRKGSAWPDWGFEVSGTVTQEDGGWPALAPSTAAAHGYAAPTELDHAGIAKVVADFTSAARRAVTAGFDAVEVHGAHGYLLHQFLSPLSNTRSDEYGGSLQNRARIVLEIVRAVREAVGEQCAVLLRLSATDWTEGGWTPEETAIVASWALEAGADLFDVSTGGNILDAAIPVAAGYQVRFASLVREAVGAPVGAVGLITDPAQAEEIVASGSADVVLLGREFLRDSSFALHAAAALDVEIDYWPAQYRQAQKRVLAASR